MIDLEAIAKDAAERVHRNGGCVPQLAFAPILFALQDALSTTPARVEALDEGAAGEPVEDKPWPYTPLADALHDHFLHVYGLNREEASESAGDVLDIIARHSTHPSPTHPPPAAQDDDRVLKPNLFWSAEGWEYTHSDLTEAYEEATGGTNSGVVKIGNALELPAIWAVQIDIDTTGDGEADDYEIKTFPTKEEADAYLADALKSTAAKEGGEA